MVSQNAIPSRRRLGGYLPYVFTEQGVAMLATVLNSETARVLFKTNMLKYVMSIRRVYAVRIIIASAVIFLSACATTQPFPNRSEEQWTLIPIVQEGADIFVDSKSIRHVSDSVVRLRLRYRYLSPKPFDSGYIEELRVYNEYDCNNKETYKILSSEAHFRNGETKIDSSERQGYILPHDVVFRYLCK